ncbi:MAG: hypothetical protein IKC23_05380 [Fibrobacter sp.]|nr:hypothetical protein [Fibrobacter sp.]
MKFHIELTYQGKEYKRKPDFSNIFSVYERGNSLLVDEDIEDPNAVLKILGMRTDFLDKEPFVNLRTNSNVWEFYLLKMFGVTEKLFSSITSEFEDDPYDDTTRQRVGNSYKSFAESEVKYPTIKDKTLKDASTAFVKRLKKSKYPLRRKDPKNIKNRIKAAKAFRAYLLQTFVYPNAILNKVFGGKDGPLTDDLRLAELLKSKGNGENKEHLLAVCLMFCLYGSKKQKMIAHGLAEEVCNGLSQYSSKGEERQKLIDTINNSLSKVSKGFKKDFYPPYGYVYDKYRDRVNVFFRIRTWMYLLKVTSKAMGEI